jgi:hypothetical protein
MYYIYAYLRDDGTFYYIGKGKGNRAYVKHPRKNGSNILPKDNTRIKILHENLSEDEAIHLEKQLISEHGRKDLGKGRLINLTDGGEGLSGYVRSQETIDKQSEKLRGKKRPLDIVDKIAKANTGKKRSEETKRKLSEAHIGKKDSEETKIKKSKSASKPKSESHKENIKKSKIGDKNPMYGKVSPKKDKPLSEDTKLKLRHANLGKKDSEETRRKKSEAHKKRHAENKSKYKITQEN